MSRSALPDNSSLHILFAHAAYQMADRFAARKTGIKHTQVRALDDLRREAPNADIVVVSMMWKNDILPTARRLKLVQSISAGTDQYDFQAFRDANVRLASAAGVNANAVAEHAMSLMLALDRQLHLARDNQMQKRWRPMISTIADREAEQAGKTVAIVGLGRIGLRLAQLCKAFGMRVIGVKRDVSTGSGVVDDLVPTTGLLGVLPRADAVVLTCPLTPETTNLIDATALKLMKPTATLINVARGKVVDEPALIAALNTGMIRAAALDVTVEEPLGTSSPLWTMPNVLITPHTAGETQAYEDNVIDILLENIGRLQRSEPTLRNGIV